MATGEWRDKPELKKYMSILPKNTGHIISIIIFMVTELLPQVRHLQRAYCAS
jgi:hypothetical protein